MEGASGRLHPDVVSLIEDASMAGELHVHPMSVWEVGTLVRRGRLQLEGPVNRWIDDALGVPGVRLVPVSAEAALGAARLPDSFPGDPVDRLLTAAAYHLGATLLTCDRRILDYDGPEAPLRLDACP